MIWRIEKNLRKGDLVYHVLYGKDWLAMVMDVKQKETSKRREVLVHMVPGSRYQDFFSRRPFSVKEGVYRGWVSENWLVLRNRTGND